MPSVSANPTAIATAAALSALRKAAVQAHHAMSQHPCHGHLGPPAPSGRLVDEYWDLAVAYQGCLGILAAALSSHAHISLSGNTDRQCLVLLTPSAQRTGWTQVTRFDPRGLPWGDTQYPRIGAAINDFLLDISIDTLIWEVLPQA